MKAYTDIEQSKKLVEILPLESADMCWCNSSVKGVNYTDEFTVHTHTAKELKEVFDGVFNHWDKYWELIPCWSLAALLDLLPDTMLGKDKEGYVAMIETMGSDLVTEAKNPIDACYEMIIKLNKQNLL